MPSLTERCSVISRNGLPRHVLTLAAKGCRGGWIPCSFKALMRNSAFNEWKNPQCSFYSYLVCQ